MILIEGPDGAGKTTLAKMISEAFGFPVIHSPGPLHSDEALEERLYWQDQLTRIDKVIMDRCYQISELMYGPVLRKKSRVTRDHYYQFCKTFNENRKNIFILSLQTFAVKKEIEGKLHLNKKESIELEEAAIKNRGMIHGRYVDFFFEQRMINSFSTYHYYEIENLPSIFSTIRGTYECEGF